MYPVGTYKVAWMTNGVKFLDSKMFDNKQDALDYAKSVKRDWLLMELVGQENDYYRWKLLPFGSYRKLKLGHRFAGRHKWSNFTSEERQETVAEYQKSQYVRLIDVFFIAPIMVYAGTFKTLPMWLRASLISIGLATFYYNGKNYLINQQMNTN